MKEWLQDLYKYDNVSLPTMKRMKIRDVFFISAPWTPERPIWPKISQLGKALLFKPLDRRVWIEMHVTMESDMRSSLKS